MIPLRIDDVFSVTISRILSRRQNLYIDQLTVIVTGMYLRTIIASIFHGFCVIDQSIVAPMHQYIMPVLLFFGIFILNVVTICCPDNKDNENAHHILFFISGINLSS